MVKVTQNFLQCSCWHHKVCKVCVRQPQTSLHVYQPLASYPGPFDFLNGPGYEANQPHERICASTHTWQAWWQLEWTWYYLTIKLELPCSENRICPLEHIYLYQKWTYHKYRKLQQIAKVLQQASWNSGKPQLIYHIWICLSFLPQHTLPLCPSIINQLWFSTVQFACCKTFAIWCNGSCFQSTKYKIVVPQSIRLVLGRGKKPWMMQVNDLIYLLLIVQLQEVTCCDNCRKSRHCRNLSGGSRISWRGVHKVGHACVPAKIFANHAHFWAKTTPFYVVERYPRCWARCSSEVYSSCMQFGSSIHR